MYNSSIILKKSSNSKKIQYSVLKLYYKTIRIIGNCNKTSIFKTADKNIFYYISY